MPDPVRPLIGWLAAFGVVVIWSGWVVVSRLGVVQTLTIYDMTALRFLVAAVAVAPFLWRHWPRHLRDKAGVPDGRLHDFRHTTGTYAAQAGLNAFMVRDLLGHKTMAMTGRYVEKATEPLRAAADAVSGRVAAAMNGQQDAEVVELPKRKA